MHGNELKIIDIPILGNSTVQVAALNVSSLDIGSWLHDSMHPLSDYRKAHALAYIQEADQQRSLGATLLLDYFLRQYNLREANMEYGKTAFGKPYFKNHPELHFNLSHSGEFAIAAFDHQPIGVDIEQLTPFEEEVAACCMQPSEIAGLKAYPETRHNQLFTTSWCLKEAILKARGTGIDQTFPIIHFEQGLPKWNEETNEQWNYRIFQLEDYMGAVAFTTP